LPIANFSYILQCNVATQLKCGEIFNNNCIASCPENVLVQKILKSVTSSYICTN